MSTNESIRRVWQNVWPGIAAAITFWAAMAWIVNGSQLINQHHVIYALDDAYIHMAIAKNIALHGVYGVSKYHVTGASSSIVWPWLVALCYHVFGVNEIAPLALNIVAGTAIIWIADRVLARVGATARIPSLRFFALVTIIAAGPLPTIAITGMEHLAHIFFMIAFFVSAANLIATETQSRNAIISTALLGMASTCFRYESLISIAIVTIVLVIRKRFITGAAILVTGIFPVIAYGLVSVTHGQFFLPNSVLMKSQHNALAVGYSVALSNCFQWAPMLPPLAVIGAGCFAAGWMRKRTWTFENAFVGLAAAACMCHLLVYSEYAFYRYAAYAIVLGVLATACWLSEWAAQSQAPFPDHGPRGWRIATCCLYLIVFIVAARPSLTLSVAVQATNNIYMQQYRDGLFLRHYYNGQRVMLNDIGAPDYLADLDVLDDVGLATTEVTLMRRQRIMPVDQFVRFVNERHVRIAIVYPSTYLAPPAIDPRWTPVARCSISNNVVCALPVVEFIAIDPAEAPSLSRAINAFYSRPLPRLATTKSESPL